MTVGNDTDLHVALTIIADPNYDLYVVTEIEPLEMWRISDIQGNCNEKHRKLIIFTYCFSGCDTTSAPFKKGKGKVIAALNKLNEKELKQLQAFAESNSPSKQLVEAGTLFALRLYGEKTESTEKNNVKQPETDINKLRYQHYIKQIGNSKLTSTFQLEALPPTSSALIQHNFRVDHSVQQFMGNDLAATDWGWIKKNGTLYPVLTHKAIAPDNLLEMILCGCKLGCTRNCGRRKISMHCTTMCKE